jgi:hypothetical protein
MSWMRGLPAVLAVCALLGGLAGCGSSAAREPDGGVSASPVGKVLEETDKEGRHYREVDDKGAPKVAVEVQPDLANGWDVTLSVERFSFSPAGTRAEAVPGRGTARLYLDGRSIADLRTSSYRLPAKLVPRGTHQVTARLYADDDTVWAVDGDPVESTADITASDPEPSATP